MYYREVTSELIESRAVKPIPTPTSTPKPTPTPTPTPTPPVFIDITCQEKRACPTRICYHNIGNRIPLKIEAKNPKNAVHSYPKLSPVCTFELENPCTYCSDGGPNNGCPIGQTCDLNSCSCVANCTYTVQCSQVTSPCPVGYQRSTKLTDCYNGERTCCTPCAAVYSSSLADTSSDTCWNYSSSCCPKNFYPDSSTCNCLSCNMNVTDPCLCDRCNSTSLFTPLTSLTNPSGYCSSYALVNLYRYNPYGCSCVRCDSSQIVCPAGQVLFPPSVIQICDDSNKNALLNWLAKNTNAIVTGKHRD